MCTTLYRYSQYCHVLIECRHIFSAGLNFYIVLARKLYSPQYFGTPLETFDCH
jgi:hypothetical protein